MSVQHKDLELKVLGIEQEGSIQNKSVEEQKNVFILKISKVWKVRRNCDVKNYRNVVKFMS